MAVALDGREHDRLPRLGSTMTGAQTKLGAADIPALTCSVGIMAYNEEANIANAIETILTQTTVCGQIMELIVVASGCTDRTTAIVTDIARKDSRVRLIEQEGREGKASAINMFIEAASAPILLMVSADLFVKEGSIDALLRHFRNPAVGMTGGRPIPVNDEATFLGYAAHLLWRLHDRVARQAPKLGEIVAFRNVVSQIPCDTAVDEVSIQALITELGFEVVYDPQAIVYNRGPSAVSDFLGQRRRIYAGHLHVRKQDGYATSTMSLKIIWRALVGSGSFSTPRAACRTACVAGLEALARILGYYDYLRQRKHHVWKPATTTKRELAAEASAESRQIVLIFRVENFNQRRLELGTRACRRFADRVVQHIEQDLGRDTVVYFPGSGTFVALSSGDQADAEVVARRLLARLEETSVSSERHSEATAMRVTCGMMAFARAQQPLAKVIPDASGEPSRAVVAAS
jgi:biofilm PGA synthesis N-glycosyltransferase PgaC